MRGIPKWKEKINEAIPKMSNETLLEEYVTLSNGDDRYEQWLFSVQGAYKFSILHNELYKRLKECKFLTE